MRITQPKLWIAFFTAVVGLVAACAIPLLFMYFSGKHGAGADPAISLSILTFAGLVGMIAILTMVACTFSALDLADRKQALGLPEGSIRAVIALGLIVIFVISSLFLFGRLAEGQTIVTSGLTAEQVAQISGTELINRVPDKVEAGATPTYTVTRHLGPTRASEDFSRQLLTTISTLVVSIASFYFGSKAVEMGQVTMDKITRTSAEQEPPPPSPLPPPAGPATPTTPPAGSSTPATRPAEPATPGVPPAEPSTPSKPPSPGGASGPSTPDGKPGGQPEAPDVHERLAPFMSKRVPLSEVPESSGALERGSDGKLRLVRSDAPAPVSSSTVTSIGEITSDHWLDTAKRAPIGTGGQLEPLFVVIHYTEGYSAESSISGWQKADNGILAHIVIDRDGKIFQCRPFNQSCQHAGKSRTRHPQTNKLFDGLNSFSIGIEIASTGDGGDDNLHGRLQKHFPQAEIVTAKHRNDGIPGSNAAEHKRTQWEAYPKAQLDAVFGLIRLLMAKYAIVDITGHDCVAYERKTDPGPAFPMEKLRAEHGLSGLPAVWDKSGNKINV